MTETTQNSSSLAQKFTQLQNATKTTQNTIPKIQKVPHYLRGREHFAKHYSPKLVAIGPIHRNDSNLELGQKYKLIWAAMYLERTNQDAKNLFQKILSNIGRLKELFADDVIEKLTDEELSWMLFVDGCSLLQILDKGKPHASQEINVKIDQLVLVLHDILLLENQLPFDVLKLLSTHGDDDTLLIRSMNNFLECNHHLSPRRPEIGQGTTKDEDRELAEDGGYVSVYIKNEDTLRGEHIKCPFHLLDQLRRHVLDDTDQSKTNNQNTNEDCMTTYRNITELRAVGIKLKSTESRSRRYISFSYRWMCLCAELMLPEILVDDTTATTYLNLIAYETCPDFENKFEICSFVAFMDSLIDHPEDVKELRKAKVLRNALGSDEEVAQLFNTISADLMPNPEIYSKVRCQIEKHYRNRWRTWIALGYQSHFSNPWAIIAFLGAIVALILTFIQTWLAINPVD
ncbi:unnamed protein product [Sphenostylis stenocarpa]|uniref:Uncharacterized protein n=1 Tax=Sphenostylis stenocarpa TaxID=92480 RepID=A0AA86S8T8_9FABA|nr:unnamed protein product [Sphenostylis stenocarpa]